MMKAKEALRTVFLSIGMLCGFTMANAAPSATYIPPVPDEIPLVASSLVPSGQNITSADFDRAKDCGFNTTFARTTAEDAPRIINDAANSKLKLIVVNGLTRDGNPASADYKNQLDNFVKVCSKFQSVIGYDFRDEPSWASLPGLKKRYDLFQQILHKYNSKQFLFLNVVGVEENSTFNPKMKYAAYVNHIAEMFHPNQLSIDFYPILRNPGEKHFDVRYKMFYRDLADLAAMRQEYGIPFWSYCMSMEHTTEGGHYHPRPTEGHLRFEAYSALAYGAQGLLYWTYSQRPSNATETYISAPINLKGKKTRTWNRVRNVNREIRAFNPVFFNAVPLKCVHTGEVASRIHPKGYTASDAAKENLPEVKITSQRDGVLISHMKNGNKRYIVMANQNPFKSQTIKFSLPEGFDYKEYSTSNGRLKISDISTRQISRRLKAGGIIVLEYSK